MNILQIYLLGCFLAYPIAFYFLKSQIKSDSKGALGNMQMFLKDLNFDRSIKFYYNLIISMMVILSWIMVIIYLYIYIKLLFEIVKYYLFRK